MAAVEQDDNRLGRQISRVDTRNDIVSAGNTRCDNTPIGSQGDLTKLKRHSAGSVTIPDHTAGLEMEAELKGDVESNGADRHDRLEIDGVREKRELVDLGNGLEEVIVVNWEKDDPGVSS
jgi:hypothetical protein